jgi:hypothetical protein
MISPNLNLNEEEVIHILKTIFSVEYSPEMKAAFDDTIVKKFSLGTSS